jgi:mRNA interferase MazF
VTDPKRGELWLAELDKRRPVVILTRDPMGRYLHSVLVAPVTSTARGVSTEVALSGRDGVRRPSVVNLDNTQLLDKSNLLRPIGRVRPQSLTAICRALAIATGCD